MGTKASKTAVYLRVSTNSQDTESQRRAIDDYLANHGIEGAQFYEDKLSGKNLARPEFQRLQKDIFNGRVKMLIVWKLDRLSRNLRDGIITLCDLLEKDIRIIAIAQQLDFAGPGGKLVAACLFALAESERENISANVKRGLDNARRKGVKLGKPRTLHAARIIELTSKGATLTQAAKQLGFSRAACYACLKRENVAT